MMGTDVRTSDECIQISLPDEQATLSLAEDLALCLKSGDCLALSGDLGAGKSTLARAIIRTIADDHLLDVPSPTFTLVQHYDLRLPIGHFDLYRMSDPEELEELGLDEILADGAALIEWPDMAGDDLPSSPIEITLSHKGDGRSMSIGGPAEFMARFARSRLLRKFISQHYSYPVQRRYLQGDASARAYEKIYLENQQTAILMDAPTIKGGPVICNGKTYPELAKLATNITPFIAIDKLLIQMGFRAPDIYAYRQDDGMMILEDLGQTKIIDETSRPIAARYQCAVEMLAHLHVKDISQKIIIDDHIKHDIPLYDDHVMAMEVELLPQWYAPFMRKKPLSPSEMTGYFEIWQGLFECLKDAEQSLVLRDFHSPNIIWQDNASGLDQVGVIDFQDSLIGPSAYDVVSLAQDVRVNVSHALERQIVDHYKMTRHKMSDMAKHSTPDRDAFNGEAFEQFYAILSAQRNCKILGGFVRLDQRDNKPDYLKYLPQVRSYLSRSLQHSVLDPLRNWLDRAEILPDES